MVRFPDAKSGCSRRGEAEGRIINFKTTWSEFQKASPTAAERGEAELRILDFKVTWSAELHITILKKHHLPRVGPKQLCASAPLGCTDAADTS